MKTDEFKTFGKVIAFDLDHRLVGRRDFLIADVEGLPLALPGDAILVDEVEFEGEQPLAAAFLPIEEDDFLDETALGQIEVDPRLGRRPLWTRKGGMRRRSGRRG